MPLFPVHSLDYAYAERNFLKKFGDAGRCITQGVTTPDIRRDRMREFIVASNLTDADMWRTADGASETYREAWERLFGLVFCEEVEAA